MFIHIYKGRPRENLEFYHIAGFTIQKDMYKPVSEWCYQTFGDSGDCVDNARWEDHIWFGEIWFRDEKDLMLFKLRWA